VTEREGTHRVCRPRTSLFSGTDPCPPVPSLPRWSDVGPWLQLTAAAGYDVDQLVKARRRPAGSWLCDRRPGAVTFLVPAGRKVVAAGAAAVWSVRVDRAVTSRCWGRVTGRLRAGRLQENGVAAVLLQVNARDTRVCASSPGPGFGDDPVAGLVRFKHALRGLVMLAGGSVAHWQQQLVYGLWAG
jgi:hypothetical protein